MATTSGSSVKMRDQAIVQRRRTATDIGNGEHHVVPADAPHRSFGALGLLGAEVLPDQRRRGVGHAPGRHQREHHDADRDRRAGDRFAADAGQDPHQEDPRRHRHDHLADAAQRSAHDVPHDRAVPAPAAKPTTRMCLPPRNRIHSCIQHARCRGRCRWPSPRLRCPSPETGRSRRSASGHSTMLRPLASHSTRIAMAASPAPRKIALMTNSSMITALPPSIHCM